MHKFEAILKQLGKKIEIKIYDDAGHAFENPNNKDGYRARRCRRRLEAHRRFSCREFERVIASILPPGAVSGGKSLLIQRLSNLLSASFDMHLFYGTNFHLPENPDLVTMSHPAMLPTINIGETIRNYRLQKGMSQGDIEKRTGLLRCYLSRVENGHTIPSLDTLSKIAGAMEIALSQFFSESGHTNGSKGLPQLSDDEVRFLSQVRRYSASLNDSDRKLVLAMVKKMAANSK